jgi:hypothetical protein
MKIKKNLKVSTFDFWYDLTQGGYIDPKKICADKSDAERVIAAVKVVEEFQRACEACIEGFDQ